MGMNFGGKGKGTLSVEIGVLGEKKDTLLVDRNENIF